MAVQTLSFFLLSLFLQPFYFANSQSFLGVNYGEVADNLPPLSETAKLLQSTTIEKVRLYGADPVIIGALANTGIGIVIGAANGDIPGLSDPNVATQWVNSNVLPFYPASKIRIITVGNEIITSADQDLISHLLPAMQNIQNALNAVSLGGMIQVSTVHSMAVLTQSDPPSSGSFDPSLIDTFRALLEFQKSTNSPFMINPYPFFAYQSDPTPETLAFCLFQPNSGRVDSGTGITYMNMFDSQVDSVRSALNRMGFNEIEIVIAETGWPYKGDPNEVGACIENAKGYNGNLINHLRTTVGTPLMPAMSVETYIFAVYDENLKSGPASERAFGLFKPDLTMTYDIGLLKSSLIPIVAVNNPSAIGGGWCVPKMGVSNDRLQANIDYACGQGIDCSPIEASGSCFEPNTVQSHAAFAMNLLYQIAAKNPWNCDFLQTATFTNTNPSYNGCKYPGGG